MNRTVALKKFTLTRCYNTTVSRYYVENFGCRATQADGAAIERELAQNGLDRASAASDAEVVVLNTCTVTASADQDARAAIRRIHRQNPDCKILVTGCYAQRAPQELAGMPGVTWVVGNSHKMRVADIALQSTSRASSAFVPLSGLTGASAGMLVGDIFAHTELMAAPVFDADISSERTRPNLKVQDGCDNRCSFCVIPYVRGQSRSLNLDRVLQEVNALVALGYREVVISGINLGRWGRDFTPAARFEDLVRAILTGTSLERLRLSSIEPMDWSEELIQLVATSPRIAKHAHVPMQSGSDRILRAMHRKYRPWHYRDRVQRIREAIPNAAIGADVMVGFPGETDDDFAHTRRMIEDLPFTYLHVFTYSARPATPAASLPDQVPVHIARDRNRILRDIAAAKKLAFQRSFLGKTIEAITLSVFDGEFTEALTDNYLKLRLSGHHPANQWLRARVLDVRGGTLIGSLSN